METGEFTTPEGNKLRYYCTGAGNRTFVLHQTQERDFVLYYFAHQYAWNSFPEKDRERILEKLT